MTFSKLQTSEINITSKNEKKMFNLQPSAKQDGQFKAIYTAHAGRDTAQEKMLLHKVPLSAPKKSKRRKIEQTQNVHALPMT